MDAPSLVPVTEDELSEFRRRWVQEVEAKKDSRLAVPPTTTLHAATPSAVQSRSAIPEPKDTPSLAIDSTQNDAKLPAASLDIPLIPTRPGHRTPSARVIFRTADSPHDGDGPSAAIAAMSPAERAEEALRLYDLASTAERQGNLSKALEFYQSAHKLEGNIDQLYRRKWASNTLPTTTTTSTTSTDDHDHIDLSYQYAASLDDVPSDPTTSLPLHETLARTPGGLVITPRRPHRASPLTKLPGEVLLALLRAVGRVDFVALNNASEVCRRLYVLARETGVWRDLCAVTYMGAGFGGAASLAELEREVIVHGDWRRMLIHKPRLRLDGVYISRCNYWRQGHGEGFYTPYILVSYFRFLRFFKDGSVVSVCTSLEPVEVVKLLRDTDSPTTAKQLKNICRGNWRLTDKTLEIHLSDRERPRTKFAMRLAVNSVKTGSHNALKWVRYTSRTGELDEVAFPLKNLSTFHFSRVRSYI
ncbi:hypothetical protein M427DRAFT_132580 [Gonapodya prolifera JEL478]|uniref:F-box domain-containing protein n=1 Tax=Gonapodya prolifera (strain JEL478) TaxID=1344416 RepID=A0A139API4_GONPJ|nr:hypothetical protein M427DRAFT_132580 [Gonapodya prolifera JEL478]|eukprot:KXS18638.1 hypothetical protein M427DRAFT_132580 [Gonapodya prolifera JEL478]